MKWVWVFRRWIRCAWPSSNQVNAKNRRRWESPPRSKDPSLPQWDNHLVAWPICRSANKRSKTKSKVLLAHLIQLIDVWILLEQVNLKKGWIILSERRLSRDIDKISFQQRQNFKIKDCFQLGNSMKHARSVLEESSIVLVKNARSYSHRRKIRAITTFHRLSVIGHV